MPVVGAIDDATGTHADSDPLNPSNGYCPLSNACTGMNTPYLCCTGPQTGAGCIGGCQVQLTVGVTGGSGITVKKGPPYGTNGSDTAILIEDKMHFNMGK